MLINNEVTVENFIEAIQNNFMDINKINDIFEH